MLTKEAEVDERLKHMNEVFLASLEGLKSGSSRRRKSAGGSGRGDESGGEGSNSQSSSLSGYRGVGGGGGSGGLRGETCRDRVSDP
ncbi:hypothetical protein HYDPIDRAFT_116659 [Hydnomerulius pinastri MD-312]|uniref:Uncharacterized protein n=1 Tax=Hydnomerulius pinastri MD-312 TaxID=994086 RepID=A0A0C9W3K8_9AGAM|nr:hypothetical protein HYDPIDRAFT_116659 [Hydnomerulius pinastri MD-312]